MSPLQSVPDRTGKTTAQPDPSNEQQQEAVTSSASATDKSAAWKPALDRQQSSNEQDMKRRYQERLLGVEKGKEAGFSSKDREGSQSASS